MGLFDEVKTTTEAATPSGGEAVTASTRQIEADFLAFWEHWPKGARIGKMDAQKKYRIARRKASAQDILDGVENYKKTKESWKAFCNPATFLHQGRWMDETAAYLEAEKEASGYDTDDSSELASIEGVLRWLGRACGIRVDTPDFEAKIKTYRRILRSVPVSNLRAAAEAWAGSSTKFPKPFELKQAVPARVIEHRVMSESESREYRAAEVRGWEGDACGCRVCVEEGVWQNRRYVPEEDHDGQTIQVYDPLGRRVVTSGRWIHGEELRRWYAASAACWLAVSGQQAAQDSRSGGREGEGASPSPMAQARAWAKRISETHSVEAVAQKEVQA